MPGDAESEGGDVTFVAPCWCPSPIPAVPVHSATPPLPMSIDPVRPAPAPPRGGGSYASFA